MADDLLGFWTWGAGDAGFDSSGLLGSAGDGDSIVSDPHFGGAFAASIDPVNGNSITERYGFTLQAFSETFIAIVGQLYVPSPGYDEAVHLATSGGVRRLTLNTAEAVQIQDADGDEIEITASSTFPYDTVVPFYWYMDSDNERDILWMYLSGAWSKLLDTTGHGDYGGGFTSFTRADLGSGSGKALPTTGDPFLHGPGCVIANPTVAGIGSAKGYYKPADGDGTGTRTWSGGAPDWQKVDDAADSQDGDTTYDAGDAAGERTSYTVANAETGDAPLAVQPVGSGRRTTAGVTNKVGLSDGSTDDYQTLVTVTQSTSYDRRLGNVGCHTLMPNGNPWTEAGFNAIEVIGQIVSRSSGEVRITQFGAEYMVEGAYALPSDFPSVAPAENRRRVGQII